MQHKFMSRGIVNIRVTLRIILGFLFLFISKVLIRSTVFCGVNYYTKRLKKTDKLFILAPGSSINEMSKNDFQEISRYDSIGLNYFLFHEFTPTSYLIETHDTSWGYFDYIVDNVTKFSSGSFLYKGYNSPNRIFEFSKNLYILRKANLQRFHLMKDAYLSDHESSNVGKGVSGFKSVTDDYFYNDIASLLYVIMLGYSCGYKEVILCGFDMSTDYFYNHPKYRDVVRNYSISDNRSSMVNTVSSNFATTRKILSRIQDFGVFFNHRQGGIYQFNCKGQLGEALKRYSYTQ